MIRSGQVTVAAAGTAVQASTDEAWHDYWFRAHKDNTNEIYIGNDGTNDVSSTTGLTLAPTDPPILVHCMLSELYVDVQTNSEKLCWFFVER